jgi:hypothetical protein
MVNKFRYGALALLAALAGCATISSEPFEQEVTVRTIEDGREIVAVGCVLSNDAGRWFVMAPGRVNVRRSAGNLFVDCKKQNMSAGQELFASRPNNTATIGNVVTTAGLGYLLDKQTGAGWDYPAVLTVLMKPAKPAADPQRATPTPQSTVVY